MKCQSCGAPLVNAAGRDTASCDFCGVVNRLSARGVDRVSVTEALAGGQCPDCTTELRVGLAEGVKVGCCPDCEGLLFDRPNFAEVVDTRRAKYEGADEIPGELSEAEFRRLRACPRCDRQMETYTYSGPGRVVVDGCGECKVVWVDAGELTRIEKSPGKRPNRRERYAVESTAAFFEAYAPGQQSSSPGSAGDGTSTDPFLRVLADAIF